MKKKRSIGVTIFGVIFSIAGIILLLGFLFFSISLYLYVHFDRYVMKMLPGDSYRFISCLCQNPLIVVLAVTLLISGLGFLFLKPWSRKVALYVISPMLILSSPFIAYDIIDMEWAILEPSIMLLFDPMHIHIIIITFIVNVGMATTIIYFFTRNKTRAQFN